MNIPTCKLLFQAFITDEKNATEYVPSVGEIKKEETEDGETEKYSLHMGKILGGVDYTKIINADYNSDYADISNSGTVTLNFFRGDLDYLYLGVRCRIAQQWVTDEDNFDIRKMPEKFLGFITEESFSDDQTKLSLSGMTKCLDRKYEFDFSQMPISEIIREVIKTAGLTPVVDFTGLEDQVIDFSNVSNDSSNSGDVDTSGVEVSSDLKTLAKNICKGQKGALAKAKAIFHWLHDSIRYEYYYNHRYSPQQVVSRKGGNCVDHALLYYHLGTAVGLKVGFVNVGCLGGHVYNGIDINGKIYTADASVKSIGVFNKTKGSCPMVTASNISYNWSMWG